MKERLQYFDMMKGLAIYMVVMGHVVAFCVRGIDHTLLFKIIACVHMPLFFFISGWFSCRTDKSTGRLKAPSLSKRFLQLMVPLAVVPTLWMWFFPHSGLQSPFHASLSSLWTDFQKYGYWFTLCLFEISVLFLIIAPLLRRYRNIWIESAITAAIWAMLILASEFLTTDRFGGTLGGILGIYNVACYWPAFMFGFIASRHRETFANVTGSGICRTICIIAMIPLLYYGCYYWEFEALNNAFPQAIYIVNALRHVCLAVVAVAIVKPWAEMAFAPQAQTSTRTIASLWAFLGRKSLAIYLLHYFFLFPLGFCRDILTDMHLAFVPMAVFCFIVAACIIACVLTVNVIISKSPLLALLLTGEIPKSIFRKSTGATIKRITT